VKEIDGVKQNEPPKAWRSLAEQNVKRIYKKGRSDKAAELVAMG